MSYLWYLESLLNFGCSHLHDILTHSILSIQQVQTTQNIKQRQIFSRFFYWRYSEAGDLVKHSNQRSRLTLWEEKKSTRLNIRQFQGHKDADQRIVYTLKTPIYDFEGLKKARGANLQTNVEVFRGRRSKIVLTFAAGREMLLFVRDIFFVITFGRRGEEWNPTQCFPFWRRLVWRKNN